MFTNIIFISVTILIIIIFLYIVNIRNEAIDTLYASINMGDQLIREVKQNYRYTSPWNTPKECKATVTNKGEGWIQVEYMETERLKDIHFSCYNWEEIKLWRKA